MSRSAEWVETDLGSCVDLLAGFAFKSDRFSENPTDVPLVKGENLQQGYVDWGRARRWPLSEYRDYEKFSLRPGDVVLAMDRPWVDAGLKWAFIGPRDPSSLLVQRVARLRAKKGVSEGFVRAIVGSLAFSDYVQPIVTGVNVPHISGDQIRSFGIRLPPFPIQCRIAAIVAAYDDLIENNLRRIRILEELAQALYREWFVEFRFPGHEKLRMVSSEVGSIPFGWSVKRLGEVITLEYGEALRADKRELGPIPVFGSSGVVGFHSVSLVDGPGIIVGRKGNVGSVHWSDGPFFPIDTVYYVRTSLDLRYAFFNLQTQNFINNDAAVPGLNRNQAYSLPVVLPPVPLQEKFSGFVEPVFLQLCLLRKRNENLRLTRDLLLPRLISGDLDVSNLDIVVPEAVA